MKLKPGVAKPTKGEDYAALFLPVPQGCSLVESSLLEKVGWGEVFRARTALLLLTDYAANSANNHMSKHHL